MTPVCGWPIIVMGVPQQRTRQGPEKTNKSEPINKMPPRMSLSPAVSLFLRVALVLMTASTAPAIKASPDPSGLELASVNALVFDLERNDVLYARNVDNVVPIASITKLMTALVVLDARLPLDEPIPVRISDIREMRNVFSRLRLESQLPRRQMLQLALMSSENRAASSLGHSYPGGLAAFVKAMNAKAQALGMTSTHYHEPTGISSRNVSTARDLTKLLLAAREYPLIRQLSTESKADARFSKPGYSLAFYNTNPLINKPDWSITLSKTGYIDEAGRCLVMLTRVADRDVALVLLDSFGKRSAIGDAQRVRRWLETGKSGPVPAAARSYRSQKTVQLAKAEPELKS